LIFKGLTIGVPKEIMEGENRVAAIPETVSKMVAEGASVLVEKGAGDGAFYPPAEYEKAGAKIVEDVEEIFKQSDLILKVKEPRENKKKGKHEIDMMKKGQVLVAFIHPASPSNHKMVKKLAEKGVISFTLDCIPRISRAQTMDALTSMSTVAGYKSIIMAADRIPSFIPMVGCAVGVIKPANVLVIGTGIAGLQAVATAKRLGAIVRSVDIRPDANEQAKSLGANVVDAKVPVGLAVGEGGYAKRLPWEFLLKEREAIKKNVAEADIVVLSALIPGKVAPILVTKEMVMTMKPGSVIIDVAIDQGGNCEITEPGKIIDRHGITIWGVKNIPGMMPKSSTWMFANNIYNYVANLVKDGKIEINRNDEIIAASLVTIDKNIVHEGTLEAMNQ